MPTITIDNMSYEVKAGKNLLEAALALGFDLPYFCWHPALGSVGACRQCAVKLFKDENDTQGKIIMSCMEMVKDGLRVSINHPAAKAFREQVIEWLMTNHPHDCPVCDEGGSCHLQDMTVMTGHDYRRFNYKKRTYNNQYLGPLIHHEMNRCIQCYRCVRYYRDYAGGEDLNVFAAHNHVYFGRETDGVLQSPFSGNLAEVCPTGVFTDKTLKEHYTRKWDLTMAPSVCHHCSLGCNIIAGERYGEIRCITNRYNGEVNGYFLCDRGRFGYEFVNSENRIKQAIIRNRTIEAADKAELLNHIKNSISKEKLIGIGSPRASMESNFMLRQLVGENNFYGGVSDAEQYLTNTIINLLEPGVVHSASLKEIELADAVLVLGEDVGNTAPIMALAIRQSVLGTAAGKALQHSALPAWHDAAIRELVQEDKGFLANITIGGSSLDAISSYTFSNVPDNIARLGFAIAHELNPNLPAVDNIDNITRDAAASIANALKQAKRPVIISGIACQNEAVLKAAYTIAATLSIPGIEAGIAFILPECNCMGLALMKAPSFEKAAERVQKENGLAAIIIENDVYRYTPPSVADDFFNQCKNVIVLESLHNATTEKANVLIPAATFAEADGTLVNYEGRAQRFYQVYPPAAVSIKESWQWISLLQLELNQGAGVPYPEAILDTIESTMPQFKGIAEVAPGAGFTIHGERIPREPHRYSGRTAILANLNVSEPKPISEAGSPLSFTMEGYKGIPPSDINPFYWSPGWNSVQSVTKYQDEPGGALKDGDPGVQLFKNSGAAPTHFKDMPEAFAARQQKWLALPQYNVCGSGELSSYSKGLQELSPKPSVGLSEQDAIDLGANNVSIVRITDGNNECTLPVAINRRLANGLALISAGLQGLPAISWGTFIKIELVREERPATIK